MVEIAKVLKTHGLNGELKIYLYLKDISLWNNLTLVYIDNISYKICRIQFYKEFGFLKLENVNDIQFAENLKNKIIYAKREDIKLEKNEFLVSDLENCSIYDDSGKLVGVVDSIEKYGSADIINVVLGGVSFSFPYVDGLIKETNLENRKIVVFRQRLNEVLV